MSSVVEDERLINQCERSTEKSITLKRDDAIRYRLVKAPVIIPDRPVVEDVIFLEDAIMNYKYVHDSSMPDCYEKSLKKLRCLLRFYLMLISPNTPPLLPETWTALRDMNLVLTEDDVLPKIREAVAELQAILPSNTDQAQLRAIKSAAELIKDFEGEIV